MIILRLPHGYFPGALVNLFPTLTISSWEHNNFVLCRMNRTKTDAGIKANSSHTGGGYILVLLQPSSEAHYPTFHEQLSATIVPALA